MITVHHLENSRSLRIVWLLEELGLDYEIKHYARNPKTMLAPAELEIASMRTATMGSLEARMRHELGYLQILIGNASAAWMRSRLRPHGVEIRLGVGVRQCGGEVRQAGARGGARGRAGSAA
mgnify:CR=1 FL=1